MADHPAVRRLKGQPDRWRRTLARETERPDVVLVHLRWDSGTALQRLRELREQTPPTRRHPLAEAMAAFAESLRGPARLDALSTVRDAIRQSQEVNRRG